MRPLNHKQMMTGRIPRNYSYTLAPHLCFSPKHLNFACCQREDAGPDGPWSDEVQLLTHSCEAIKAYSSNSTAHLIFPPASLFRQQSPSLLVSVLTFRSTTGLRLPTTHIPSFNGSKFSLLQPQERTFPLIQAAILSFSHLALIAGAT